MEFNKINWMNIKIENKDYLEFLKEVKDESVDFVCIDPPYNVLTGHKIETKIDIPLLTTEIYRILKPNSFYVIFGQMPTIVDWYNEIIKLFKFKDDITWVKRNVSAVYLPIIRQKESIYIFTKGNPKYINTTDRYEDIKMPLYLDGLLQITSLTGYISDLNSKFNKGFDRNYKHQHTNKINNDDIYDGFKNQSDRSPELCNVTNVWSFMPENKISYGDKGINVKHPTVKPIKLLE